VQGRQASRVGRSSRAGPRPGKLPSGRASLFLAGQGAN
jgi:hypothetical protein